VIDHPPDQPAIEVAKAQAVGAYYGVFVVVADRCGEERGTRWVGGTSIIAPSGYLLAGPATMPGALAEEAVLWADIDPDVAHDKALGEHNDRFLDRRDPLYLPGHDERRS
jgi:5-aminopentanamidase